MYKRRSQRVLLPYRTETVPFFGCSRCIAFFAIRIVRFSKGWDDGGSCLLLVVSIKEIDISNLIPY